MKDHRSHLLTIGVTAVATAAVAIFARNFISGEEKIKNRIAQRYGIWRCLGGSVSSLFTKHF